MTWIIYLTGVAENVQCVMVLMSTMAAIGGVIVAVMTGGHNEFCEMRGNTPKPYTACKKYAIAAIILATTSAAIPSATTIYMMAGSEVAKSPENQIVLDKVRVLINQKLDEAILRQPN